MFFVQAALAIKAVYEAAAGHDAMHPDSTSGHLGAEQSDRRVESACLGETEPISSEQEEDEDMIVFEDGAVSGEQPVLDEGCSERVVAGLQKHAGFEEESRSQAFSSAEQSPIDSQQNSDDASEEDTIQDAPDSPDGPASPDEPEPMEQTDSQVTLTLNQATPSSPDQKEPEEEPEPGSESEPEADRVSSPPDGTGLMPLDDHIGELKYSDDDAPQRSPSPEATVPRKRGAGGKRGAGRSSSTDSFPSDPEERTPPRRQYIARHRARLEGDDGGKSATPPVLSRPESDDSGENDDDDDDGSYSEVSEGGTRRRKHSRRRRKKFISSRRVDKFGAHQDSPKWRHDKFDPTQEEQTRGGKPGGGGPRGKRIPSGPIPGDPGAFVVSKPFRKKSKEEEDRSWRWQHDDRDSPEEILDRDQPDVDFVPVPEPDFGRAAGRSLRQYGAGGPVSPDQVQEESSDELLVESPPISEGGFGDSDEESEGSEAGGDSDLEEGEIRRPRKGGKKLAVDSKPEPEVVSESGPKGAAKEELMSQPREIEENLKSGVAMSTKIVSETAKKVAEIADSSFAKNDAIEPISPEPMVTQDFDSQEQVQKDSDLEMTENVLKKTPKSTADEVVFEPKSPEIIIAGDAQTGETCPADVSASEVPEICENVAEAEEKTDSVGHDADILPVSPRSPNEGATPKSPDLAGSPKFSNLVTSPPIRPVSPDSASKVDDASGPIFAPRSPEMSNSGAADSVIVVDAVSSSDAQVSSEDGEIANEGEATPILVPKSPELGQNDEGVTGSEMESKEVTADEIQNAGVTESEIQSEGVTGSEIQNEGVTPSEVSNQRVTESGIQDAVVTVSEIQSEGVTASEIENGRVTASSPQEEGELAPEPDSTEPQELAVDDDRSTGTPVQDEIACDDVLEAELRPEDDHWFSGDKIDPQSVQARDQPSQESIIAAQECDTAPPAKPASPNAEAVSSSEEEHASDQEETVPPGMEQPRPPKPPQKLPPKETGVRQVHPLTIARQKGSIVPVKTLYQQLKAQKLGIKQAKPKVYGVMRKEEATKQAFEAAAEVPAGPSLPPDEPQEETRVAPAESTTTTAAKPSPDSADSRRVKKQRDLLTKEFLAHLQEKEREIAQLKAQKLNRLQALKQQRHAFTKASRDEESKIKLGVEQDEPEGSSRSSSSDTEKRQTSPESDNSSVSQSSGSREPDSPPPPARDYRRGQRLSPLPGSSGARGRMSRIPRYSPRVSRGRRPMPDRPERPTKYKYRESSPPMSDEDYEADSPEPMAAGPRRDRRLADAFGVADRGEPRDQREYYDSSRGRRPTRDEYAGDDGDFGNSDYDEMGYPVEPGGSSAARYRQHSGRSGGRGAFRGRFQRYERPGGLPQPQHRDGGSEQLGDYNRRRRRFDEISSSAGGYHDDRVMVPVPAKFRRPPIRDPMPDAGSDYEQEYPHGSSRRWREPTEPIRRHMGAYRAGEYGKAPGPYNMRGGARPHMPMRGGMRGGWQRGRGQYARRYLRPEEKFVPLGPDDDDSEDGSDAGPSTSRPVLKSRVRPPEEMTPEPSPSPPPTHLKMEREKRERALAGRSKGRTLGERLDASYQKITRASQAAEDMGPEGGGHQQQGGPKVSQDERELYELEMRARAIKALMSKSDTSPAD